MNDYELDKISSYYKNASEHKTNPFRLDKQTIFDLNILSIFKVIDHSCSPLGQQFLYDAIINNNYAINNKKKFEADLAFLENSPEIANSMMKILSRNSIGMEYLCDFLWNKNQLPRFQYFVAVTLLVLAIVSIILSIINPAFIAFFLIVVLLNITFYIIGKKNVLYTFWGVKAFKSFIDIVIGISKVGLTPGVNKKNFEKGVEDIKQTRKYLTFIEVGASSDSVIADEMKSAALAIIEYLKMIFLLEFFSINRILKLTQKKFLIFSYLFETIAYIDFILCVNSFRNSLTEYCTPSANKDSEKVKIRNAIHPLIKNCVANDIEITQNSLISGPNMSGKTTLLRTIGVNIILAQSINTCLASYYCIAPMSVMSSINIKDNVAKNESFYKAELVRLKEIINKIDSLNVCGLVLIDEILKGTNTNERLAGGIGILKYLSKLDTVNIITTHEQRFSELLNREFKSYNFNISERLSDKVFKLQQGNSNVTNGISLMKEINLPEEIINEALLQAKVI